MPSAFALRALLGATLSIGVADVAVIDLVAAPKAFAPPPAQAIAQTDPPPPPPPAPKPPMLAIAPALPPAPASPLPAPDAAAALPPAPAAPLPAPDAAAALPPAPAASLPAPDAAPAADGETQLYFATLHADLGDAARRALADRAGRAKQARAITVTGHADYRGAESVNASLRHARADAVRAELVRLGVDPARITTTVAPPATATPAGELWRDRRVDLILTGDLSR